MVRTAVAVGDIELAGRLFADLQTPFPQHGHAVCGSRAILAEGRGDLARAIDRFREAARRWEEFGVVPEAAHARLGLGRALVAAGRTDEATEPLASARATFTRLGATPLVSEAGALLDPA
jgi:hypothetical protein